MVNRFPHRVPVELTNSVVSYSSLSFQEFARTMQPNNQLPPIGHAIHVILHQTIHVPVDLVLGRDGFALPEIWDPHCFGTLRHCIGSVKCSAKEASTLS
ncbi:hypothetical protein AKJ16_DCAP14063 [Drosera capensis]